AGHVGDLGGADLDRGRPARRAARRRRVQLLPARAQDPRRGGRRAERRARRPPRHAGAAERERLGPEGGVAMAAALDTDDAIHGINVTPLVDIMLVLLIIFMIATRLDQPGALDVQLPKAATATEVHGATLAVVVHRDGAIALDGKPATLADLRLAAQRAAPEA